MSFANKRWDSCDLNFITIRRYPLFSRIVIEGGMVRMPCPQGSDPSLLKFNARRSAEIF
jgi:hypothetical protein